MTWIHTQSFYYTDTEQEHQRLCTVIGKEVERENETAPFSFKSADVVAYFEEVVMYKGKQHDCTAIVMSSGKCYTIDIDYLMLGSLLR